MPHDPADQNNLESVPTVPDDEDEEVTSLFHPNWYNRALEEAGLGDKMQVVDTPTGQKLRITEDGNMAAYFNTLLAEYAILYWKGRKA